MRLTVSYFLLPFLSESTMYFLFLESIWASSESVADAPLIARVSHGVSVHPRKPRLLFMAHHDPHHTLRGSTYERVEAQPYEISEAGIHIASLAEKKRLWWRNTALYACFILSWYGLLPPSSSYIFHYDTVQNV